MKRLSRSLYRNSLRYACLLLIQLAERKLTICVGLWA